MRLEPLLISARFIPGIFPFCIVVLNTVCIFLYISFQPAKPVVKTKGKRAVVSLSVGCLVKISGADVSSKDVKFRVWIVGRKSDSQLLVKKIFCEQVLIKYIISGTPLQVHIAAEIAGVE